MGFRACGNPFIQCLISAGGCRWGPPALIFGDRLLFLHIRHFTRAREGKTHKPERRRKRKTENLSPREQTETCKTEITGQGMPGSTLKRAAVLPQERSVGCFVSSNVGYGIFYNFFITHIYLAE